MTRLALALFTLAATASAAAASPDVEVREVRVVGRSAAGAAWTDRPTEARRDDHPELLVVGIGRAGGRRVVLVDADVGRLELGGRAVRDAERVPWSRAGEVRTRWLLVEPHAFREEGRAAPNGTTTPWHSNVSTAPGDFGRWLGYDEITYFETSLGPPRAGAAARRRPALARPSHREEDVHGGLGTVRYKVEVTPPDGRLLASPGASAVDRFGILPSVHRVSIRRDDTI